MDVELEKEIEVLYDITYKWENSNWEEEERKYKKMSKPLQYKLIDFGFSEYIKKGMKTIELAQLHGTPRYIAPE